MDRAATTPCHAASLAEAAKRQRYNDACQQLDLDFWPLAVEVDGALGKGLQAFFSECRRRTSDILSATRGTTWAARTFTAYWAQRFSICLRRGTARAIRRVVLRNQWGRMQFLRAPDYDALCALGAG